MSTKIYDAYRVPLHRVNEAVQIFRAQLLEAALGEFHKIVGQEKADPQGTIGSHIHQVLEKCARESINAERSDYDVACWVTVWVMGRYAYVKPTSQFRLPELSVPEWIENYEYWNNSDEPDGITRRDWVERGRIWDRVLKSPRLVHEVASTGEFHSRIDLRIAYRNWLDKWAAARGGKE